MQSCCTMNVTLKIDDRLVELARHRAVDARKSLSAWLADLVKRELEEEDSFKEAASRALEAMKKPGRSDGKKFGREELHR